MTARPTIDISDWFIRFGPLSARQGGPTQWLVVWYRDTRTVLGWRRCWVRPANRSEVVLELKRLGLLDMGLASYWHTDESTHPINQGYALIVGMPGVKIVRTQKLQRKAIPFDPPRDWIRVTAKNRKGSDRDARGVPIPTLQCRGERPPEPVPT